MFLFPSLDLFTQMVQDPHYSMSVEPDEHNFNDKKGTEGGVVAIFHFSRRAFKCGMYMMVRMIQTRLWSSE